MTQEEWAYHRKHSKTISPLGECSRMRDGRFKVEGYEPFLDPEKWLAEHRIEIEGLAEKLRNL